MTKQDVVDVLQTFPHLGMWGAFQVENGVCTPQELADDRREMLSDKSLECINKAKTWLSKLPKQKTITHRSPSCYGLKRLAEHEIGYTTNGQFIVAAICSGFIFKMSKNSINVAIAVPQKSITGAHLAREKARAHTR